MRIALVFLLAIVLTMSAQPVYADTSSGGAAPFLWIGCVMVSGINIVTATLGDGSVGWGLAGIAMSSAMVIYAETTDELSGDTGFYIGSGVAAALIGAANIFVARSHDTELLGMQVDPSIRTFDGERWFGLQLSSSW